MAPPGPNFCIFYFLFFLLTFARKQLDDYMQVASLTSLASATAFRSGCLQSVDWTTRLENWNGLNTCKKPFSWYDSFLESGYSLSHFTNLFHALYRCPASKSWGLKVTCIFKNVHVHVPNC